MSSLIFFLSEQDAIVATDTLVVDARYKMPMRHCSKAIHIPHVNTIFASTGVDGILNEWCFFVNGNIGVADADILSERAPEFLRETFERYKAHIAQDDLTVTVYHFGVSLTDNVVRAYAHRSERDFIAQELEYGLGIKPFTPVPDVEYVTENVKNAILPIMKNQIFAQEKVPENARIYIGGQVLVHHLTLDGRCCTYCVGEI